MYLDRLYGVELRKYFKLTESELLYLLLYTELKLKGLEKITASNVYQCSVLYRHQGTVLKAFKSLVEKGFFGPKREELENYNRFADRYFYLDHEVRNIFNSRFSAVVERKKAKQKVIK